MRNAMVEAVARAIRESAGWPTPWDDLVPSYQDTYRTQARAAVAALAPVIAAAYADGWNDGNYDTDYAARIIASLTQDPARDV